VNIDLHYDHNGTKAVRKRYAYGAIEAKMLRLLSPFINVPKVLYSDDETVVMEYLENDTSFDEAAFGGELAALHRQTGDYFGLEFDTTIGPFIQPNGMYAKWSDFFIERRALYMAREAFDERRLDSALMKKIEYFCSKLDTLLPNDIAPALIHGDIWSGNTLTHRGKNYLIDPAIYYAHNETELAFIMMFDTFGERFFKSYDEAMPIAREFFDYRYKIYQLYPYLVHLRIYGSSYLGGVRDIVEEFV